MDPSIFSCSIKRNLSPPLLSPFSPVKEEVQKLPFSPSGEGKSNPFTIACKCFNQPEALLFADADYTFSFTNGMRNIPWAFPTDRYPAMQVYLSSYLTPRLLGNYNIGAWHVPGLEYFVYRRPECYIYARSSPPLLSFLPSPQVDAVSPEKDYTEHVQRLQPDGLDLFLSWKEEELPQALTAALELLKVGGVGIFRVSEPSAAVLSEVGEHFEALYLFKPMLFSPFTPERLLVLWSKKRGNVGASVRRLQKGTFLPAPGMVNWLNQQHNLLVHYAEDVKEGRYPPVSASKCYVKWKLPERVPEKSCWEGLNYWQKSQRTTALAFSDGNVYLAESGKDGGYRYLTKGEEENFCPLLYL